MSDWVIVLEFSPGCANESFALAAMQNLVEWLREWHPAGLFNADRYALQLHLIADDPHRALQDGLALHGAAVRALALPQPCLTRAEILTRTEYDRAWDDQVPTSRPLSTGSHTLSSNESYWATRAMLNASTATELTEILVRFVISVGGNVCTPAAVNMAGDMAVDLWLGEGDPLYATAESVSIAGLMIEQWLPTLVADARSVLVRLQARAGESQLPPG